MKRFWLICLLSACCLFVSGCSYSYEISETAYVVACGVDSGEHAPYRFTFQFAKPLKISGGGEEDSGGGESKGEATSVYSTDANDLFTGLNLLNNALSKHVNLSHMKLLVFSAEQAQQDIADTVQLLMKNNQARPSTFVAISASKAEEFLKAVRPSLEANPSKFYSLIFSKKNSNFVPDTTLRDLYFHIMADGQEAVMPLVGISGSSETDDAQREPESVLGNFRAGESGGTSDSETEVSGMAVLREGKLVDTMSSKDVEQYNLCNGRFKPSYFHIPAEQAGGEQLVLDMRQLRKPRYHITLRDGQPVVQVDVKLAAQLVLSPSADGNDEARREFAQQYLQEELKRFLYCTTQQAQSDIVGFGRHAKKLFSRYDNWKAYNWRAQYPRTEFDVKVDLRITNSGLIERE